MRFLPPTNEQLNTDEIVLRANLSFVTGRVRGMLLANHESEQPYGMTVMRIPGFLDHIL